MCCTKYFKKCFSFVATTTASILLSVTAQFPIFTKFLCVIFQSFVFILQNISEHISHDILKQFFLCLKNILSPDAWAAPTWCCYSILCFHLLQRKRSEASNLLHLLFFNPALFCEANLICVDCMHYGISSSHSLCIDSVLLLFPTVWLSSRAIHRGPGLPAVFGSSEDPTTVPGSYDHLQSWNLMLNKKITRNTSIWFSHCTISLGRMVISRNDVFQFDVNFTLLLFRSFLHLSLCFIDRRSTPHNISSFIKISFRKGNFFHKKVNCFFLHTTSARKKGAYCKHISVSVFAFVSIGLKRETCDFF